MSYVPINSYNLISGIILKSSFTALELTFLIYSIKTPLEISEKLYTYLIFSLGINQVTNFFQSIKYIIESCYFYNKVFIDKEFYELHKKMLYANNLLYKYIYNIFSFCVLLNAINEIVFAFLFVSNISNISNNFIKGMIWFHVICGFIGFAMLIICLIVFCSLTILYNRIPVNNFVYPINNGLSSEIINKIKILEIPPNDTCGICLNNDETQWMILPCKHYFHSDCLKLWLENNKTCPNCRKEITVLCQI